MSWYAPIQPMKEREYDEGHVCTPSLLASHLHLEDQGNVWGKRLAEQPVAYSMRASACLWVTSDFCQWIYAEC